MAFNPFESFRKNQRSLMAFAAIVCMIVFVFSFGQGDFFQTLQEWLATRTRPGTQVTTLYGEPVFEAQLDKIARQRDLANTFMVRTTALGVNMAMTELEKQQKDIKEAFNGLSYIIDLSKKIDEIKWVKLKHNHRSDLVGKILDFEYGK